MFNKEDLITETSTNSDIRKVVRRLQEIYNAQESSNFVIPEEPAAWSNTEGEPEHEIGDRQKIEGTTLTGIWDGRGWQRYTQTQIDELDAQNAQEEA